MEYKPIIIEPQIKIRSNCVFCNRSTENVAVYVYKESFIDEYDYIRIHFPAHQHCLTLRKFFKFFSLILGFLFFIGLYLLAPLFFPSLASFSNWPVWLWAASLILAAVASGFCFLKIHCHIVGIIHEYYVMNEIIGEADKSWRVNARRRSMSQDRR